MCLEIAITSKFGEKRIVCGKHAAVAALKKGSMQTLVVAKGSDKSIVEAAMDAGVRVEWSNAEKLDRMAKGARHQGIVAVCESFDHKGWREVAVSMDNPLLLVLDRVEDARNLGSCVRTAATMGVGAIVVPQRHSASMTPAASKAACGGEEAVEIDVVKNIARELRAMKKAGLFVVGSDPNAPTSVWDLDGNMPLVVVMGGEAKGMRRQTKNSCDVLAAIPMSDQKVVECLGVSVACGIFLAAIKKSRLESHDLKQGGKHRI